VYDELYAAWRLEIENGELGSLPSDFYSRVAEYLRRIKEENKMTEKKSVKTNLLDHEMTNAQRMAQELLATRYRKLVKMVVAGRKVPADSLTVEENKLYNGITPSTEAYGRFVAGIIEGHVMKIDVETAPSAEPPIVNKRVTLRFLKPVPNIIGADMKSYGPFLVEDVASVPVENAKILIKQGLAKAVELQ
jgi:DNA replication initiation complex subunit (GINS family)